MTDKRESDNRGIPLKGMFPDDTSIVFLLSSFALVLGALGFTAAWFWAYASRRGAADDKIVTLANHDLGWLYLGLIAIKLGQLPLSAILLEARKASRALPPDQHVYEVKGTEGGSKLGYVLMVADGVQGGFNRAQRAWCNYHENLPTFALHYVAASWVFPAEAFVCAIIWAAARIASATGYRRSEDGRLSGHMVAQLGPPNVLQGMLLIVAMKSL